MGGKLKLIYLSHYIDSDSPYYIGTSKPSLKPKNEIEAGADYNTSMICVENHTGTHIDAPRHFVPVGRQISDYDLVELTFKPLLIVCEKDPRELVVVEDISDYDLTGYDCILFKTGFGSLRDSDRNMYLTENPGVSPETVRWLRERHQNIRCIGIDTISMSRYNDEEIAKKTHVTAFIEDESFGEPLLFIEDMDISDVPDNSSIEKIMVIPWQIRGIDSAPCAVIGYIK